MGYFTFELILAAALALFVLWAWRKQEPRRPLTPAEIEHYLAIVEAKFPMPDALDRSALLARLRGFAERDDGRDIYMLNLLRYHERMAAGTDPAAQFAGTRRWSR